MSHKQAIISTIILKKSHLTVTSPPASPLFFYSALKQTSFNSHLHWYLSNYEGKDQFVFPFECVDWKQTLLKNKIKILEKCSCLNTWPCQTATKVSEGWLCVTPLAARLTPCCHSSVFTILIPVPYLTCCYPIQSGSLPTTPVTLLLLRSPLTALIIAKINGQFLVLMYFHHLQHFLQAISPPPLLELSLDMLLTSLRFLSQFILFSPASNF